MSVFTAYSIEEAITFILSKNSNFNTLDIQMGLIYDEEITALCSAFSENTTLTSLIMNDNQLGDFAAIELAKITSLTSVALAMNEIGPIGATAIAKNNFWTSLSLWANNLGDDGAIALAENKFLTYLDVNSNQIGPAGAQALAKHTCLTTLIIFGNQLGDDGAACFAENRHLSVLDMGYNEIGDKGAELLAADNRILTSLNIEYNQITQVGALALIKKMNLISFIYEENPIEIEYVSALEDGILNNRKTYLGIYYFANGKKNQLSPEICYLINSFLVPELTQMRFIALSKLSIFAQPAPRALSYENSQSLKRVCL